MPKSSNKRKNGKVKKYKPKPKGISKKKLEQLLKSFKENTDLSLSESNDFLELKEESILEIEDSSEKKEESNIVQNTEPIQKEDEKISGE